MLAVCFISGVGERERLKLAFEALRQAGGGGGSRVVGAMLEAACAYAEQLMLMLHVIDQR